jgi:small subunit ribosomal protein S16
MAVKLRLQRKGRKKAPFYHIVVADARSPRDGRFIERLGTYNPMTKPATILLDGDKAYDWLMKGAQPTDTVNAILKFKGILYKKHLMRGVKKGAMTLEQAMEKFETFINSKDNKLAIRVEETKKEKLEKHQFIFGTPKAKKEKIVEAPVVEEAPAEDVAEVATEEVATEEVVNEVVADVTSDAIAEEVVVVATPEVVAEEVVVEAAPEVVAEEIAPEVIMEQGEDAEFAQLDVQEEAAPETPADDVATDETTEA